MSTNFIFANIFNVTLQSPITSSGATTMTLSSTTNAPTITAGQNWVVALNDAATQTVYEIVYVTARTGAVCTILRGQEGTAATTWLAGDNVYAPDTAGILNNFALMNGSSSQNFAVAGLTMTGALTGATTGTFSGVLKSTFQLFAGVANTNSASTNLIGVGNVAGGVNSTYFGAGTNALSTVDGIQPVIFGISAQGTEVTGMAMNGLGDIGFFNVVVAGNGGGGDIYSTAGTNGAIFQAGSTDVNTRALDFGNALGTTNYTRIYSGSDTVNTITNTVFGIANNTGPSSGTPLITIDASGDLGILGTLHQTSRRDAKDGIEYIDPEEALNIVLATKIARYNWKGQAPLENGQRRHASFIADETPWELSGGPGFEHADPQKTASYALAAIAALHDRVVALEGKYPTA